MLSDCVLYCGDGIEEEKEWQVRGHVYLEVGRRRQTRSQNLRAYRVQGSKEAREGTSYPTVWQPPPLAEKALNPKA